MTKAENLAAAKAWHRQRMQRMREAHALAVAADIEKLRRLRLYLIFGKKAGVPAEALIDAIDDCAGQLTGNRACMVRPTV